MFCHCSQNAGPRHELSASHILLHAGGIQSAHCRACLAMNCACARKLCCWPMRGNSSVLRRPLQNMPMSTFIKRSRSHPSALDPGQQSTSEDESSRLITVPSVTSEDDATSGRSQGVCPLSSASVSAHQAAVGICSLIAANPMPPEADATSGALRAAVGTRPCLQSASVCLQPLSTVLETALHHCRAAGSCTSN